MAETFRYQVFTLGDFQTNAYILWDETRTVLIDPGYHPAPLMRTLIGLGRSSIQAIFLTHAHVDHIAGVDEVVQLFPCPVYLHRQEVSWLRDPERNLSALFSEPVWVNAPAESMEEGPCPFLPGAFLYHTPGHSPGSLSLSIPDQGWLFGGDLLFRGSVGRTDLPGGDYLVLQQSLRRIFEILPPSTLVLPGHGPSTQLRQEESNPYVLEALQPRLP